MTESQKIKCLARYLGHSRDQLFIIHYWEEIDAGRRWFGTWIFLEIFGDIFDKIFGDFYEK